MILKLIIASCILIWDADCQGPYNSFHVPNIGQTILENLRNFIPHVGFDPFGGRGNSFSQAPYNNNEQPYDNNALGTEKRALTEEPNLQTQQPLYQTNPQLQQTTYQPNTQSQFYQQNQQSQVQNYQQPQKQQRNPQQQQNQQNYQNNLQKQQQQQSYQSTSQWQQQQNYLQSVQQTQQRYQQNLQQQPQQNYQQNLQPQKQHNYQQTLQPQKQQNYKQNLQPQKEQNYQQNLQQQQQNSEPNLQYQQEQNYQNNAQPQNFQAPQLHPIEQNIQQQPQDYGQNLQSQQQNYQQNIQSQMQQSYPQKQHKYQQNQQPQNYNTRPSSTLTTSNEGISSRFDVDGTGKTSPNANYNNETFAITRFGLKLLKGVNYPGNVVFSPYSIAMLLALVQQGARGYTQQEITQALQLKPENSADLYKKLTPIFKRRGTSNILKVANSVVLKNTFNVDRKFKTNAIQNFGSEVTSENFYNPQQTVDRINYWVSEKTGRKINNLLAPDALQFDTLAVLVNAVYFKGTWDIKFRPELTMTKDFTLSDGSKKPVPFMQARRLFQTDIDLVIKSQVLLLPFKDNQYSMMFILPLEGTNVNDVMLSLTEPQLYSYQNMSPKEVKLEIPRFTIQQDSDVTRLLNDLNIWLMFGNNADLTGIGSEHGVSPRISSGVHSAVLSIDENGGSAAAATAYSVVALSYDDPSTSFQANRPFIAILWDNQLRMPLFMSKIEDPSA